MLAKYVKVFDVGIQNTFVYRWNFLLRSAFSLVPLAGTVFIWEAMFDGRGDKIGAYDLASMIWYFLLVILMDNFVLATDDEWRIAAEIRDGQISSFLTRPMDYLAYRISLSGAYRVVYVGVTLIPVLLIFTFFRSYVSLPDDPLTWVLFGLSAVMAAAISFLISFSLAMLAFWISEVSTVIFIVLSFEYFLNGQSYPLDIMPQWFQSLIKWLPFTYEVFFPVQVFMERVKGADLWQGLAIQAGWVLITFGMARAIWSAGVKRYRAAGG